MRQLPDNTLIESTRAITPKKLSDAAKMATVCALACFDNPTAVAQAIRKEFGIDITPQSIEAYDPTKRAGRSLSAKWRAVFDETRQAFLTEAGRIPISHRAVRLRALDRMATKAEEAGNMALAAQLLEQAAKEVGDAYTNKRQLSGPGGGPIISQIERVIIDPAMTPKEAARLYALTLHGE